MMAMLKIYEKEVCTAKDFVPSIFLYHQSMYHMLKPLMNRLIYKKDDHYCLTLEGDLIIHTIKEVFGW